MADHAFLALLTDLHRSIDLVAQDLSRDRPALADALRRRAAWIPRPEEVEPTLPSLRERRATGDGACRAMPSLLYRALDEGVLSAPQFDSLMVGQSRAARVMRERAP
ncbi:MAG TPA: hypothetical protein VFF06_09920 [Polyangia bacterium]|nr:hypothetical protein [Polyangia bacterium]